MSSRKNPWWDDTPNWREFRPPIPRMRNPLKGVADEMFDEVMRELFQEFINTYEEDPPPPPTTVWDGTWDPDIDGCAEAMNEPYFDDPLVSGEGSILVTTWDSSSLSRDDLTPEAQTSLTRDNLGGNSELSEAYSIHFFNGMGATDIVFETDVMYVYSGKNVDFLCTWKGVRWGVSVTRAANYVELMGARLAHHLLEKKITGLILARNSVCKPQRFLQSILHVFCETEEIARVLKEAYEVINLEDLGLDIKCVLSVVLTVDPNPRLYKNIL